MHVLNTAAYQFIPLTVRQLPELKQALHTLGITLNLKGTILLSVEGINLSLSGSPANVSQFKEQLVEKLPVLEKMRYNETYSSYQPFRRLCLKIKKQIIPYTDTQAPLNHPGAPYVTSHTLLSWLNLKQEIILLDARNQYEVDVGSFEGAIRFNLNHFKDFTKQSHQLPTHWKSKKIVTFCTGGIRCEKASATLLQQGFDNVYQLEGGILSYFKACGQQHYQGNCFVFDQRESVAPSDLHPPIACNTD